MQRYVIFVIAENAAIADSVIIGTWSDPDRAAAAAERIRELFPFTSCMVQDIIPVRELATLYTEDGFVAH